MLQLKGKYRQDTLKLLSDVREELEKIFSDTIKDIVLYGSYARQEETSDSDIDIMVLVNKDPEEIKEYEDIITDITVDLSLEYDLVVLIMVESYFNYNNYKKVLPFFDNIDKEGITLYG